MSFDYDKISHKNDHGSWWTSYADLFMMLSLVFLLMFVASSLRSGSAGFQQQAENKKLVQRTADLEEQIKVYNTLKDQALKQQASESEQQVYKKLMDKLSLLKDEARDEKISLQKKAKENEEKEFALNQYQQLVRSIIDTNILAKSQIQHRDQLIVTKDFTIDQKKHQIQEMEGTIAKNEKQIDAINDRLEEKISALKQEQKHHKITKAAFERKLAALKEDSENKVVALEEKNRGIEQQLGQVKNTLVQTEQQLGATEQKLGAAHETIEQQQQENTQLVSQLETEKSNYVKELAGLQQAHANALAAEKAAFEANLKKQRISAAAKAKKMAQFAAAAETKAHAMEDQLSGLRGKIAATESQLQGAQGKLAETEAEKGRALAAVEDLKGDLARTKAIANARKKLAEQIADQFAKSGLKGAVDGKTGEVTLDFGEEYFDTGSTTLKPGMRVALDKFIPIYAKSLFNDPKVADKIANVEIIGLASSTYKGYYVNPKSVNSKDKDAIDYNLRLSFGRANSIFKHVLNEGQLTPADRNRLLPLMKVVGRGYLPEGAAPGDLRDGMTEKEFCSKYNCKKAQRVVVKFNMKD